MDRASASAREFATAYELPPDLWTSTTAALEAHLERELPLPPRRTPSDAALDALADALDGDPRRATVAAVVLGRLAGARATETLLARLERRVEGPARADDAGDTTAAAALAARPLEPALLDRLALLAADDARAHPDLEVRVECALALLAHGRTDAVPFLLAVARHDTPLARARNEHLTDSPTTAWPRWRAASALEHWLDLPPRYDPDAPPATRAEIAATLERAATARSSR